MEATRTLFVWLDKGSNKWYADRKQPTVIDMPRPTKVMPETSNT